MQPLEFVKKLLSYNLTRELYINNTYATFLSHLKSLSSMQQTFNIDHRKLYHDVIVSTLPISETRLKN